MARETMQPEVIDQDQHQPRFSRRNRFAAAIALGISSATLAACGSVAPKYQPDATAAAPTSAGAAVTTTPNRAAPPAISPVEPGMFTVYGDEGQTVVADQNRLTAAGCDIGPDGSDGVAGQDTVNAARTFQVNFNGTYPTRKLVVDGEIGPATRGALQAAATDPNLQDCGKPASAPASPLARVTQVPTPSEPLTARPIPAGCPTLPNGRLDTQRVTEMPNCLTG